MKAVKKQVKIGKEGMRASLPEDAAAAVRIMLCTEPGAPLEAFGQRTASSEIAACRSGPRMATLRHERVRFSTRQQAAQAWNKAR
jgi:hypothetical protein